jgi:hypothetical protein
MQETPQDTKKKLLELPEDQLLQMVHQSNQWHQYAQYTSMMHGIAREMKEIPELPSESPKEANALTKVEFPEEGGVLTYMEGFEQPYQGYPYYEFVDKIDFIKKTSRAFVSGLYHQIKKRSKLRFFTLVPNIWFLKDMVRSWVYVNYRIIDRFKIKEVRYSQFVRELYRKFSLEVKGEHDSSFRLQIRDLVCMILEMDNAYRFRAQDILAEMDQGQMRRKPVSEIIRLINLLQSREKSQDVKDTWILLKHVVRLYLIFDKDLKSILSNVFSNLDLEKVKLSINDKPYCVPRQDYTFGFQINPSQKDSNLMEFHKSKNSLKELEKSIREESTKAHKELLEKHFEQNQKVLSHKEGKSEVVQALLERQNKEIADLDDKYNQLLSDAKQRHEKQKNELGFL